MTYRQIGTIGGRGDKPGRFARTLCGITVDPSGRLYLAGDSELQVYDAASKLRQRWATAKPALTIAVAGDGRVFAGEAGQVEIFSGDGRLIDTWVDAKRLTRVTAIGFSEDNVLVADARDRCLRRYDAHGKFLHDIGNENRLQGFLIPNGVLDFSVDGAGVIHAANPGKHRVERYTIEGKFLGYFGRFDGIDPAGFSGCCNPTNVTVAGGGRIYCTEKAEPRAKVYDSEGKLLAVIASEVFDPNCKNMDIAVDGRGRVYVADTVRLEVLVFEGGA